MNFYRRKKVISRRNSGLGDNLLATAHAWYFANRNGRSLEINWAPSMYFKDKSINAFGRFFKVPSEIGNVPIEYQNRVGFFKRLYRRLPLFPFKFFLSSLFAEITHKILRNRTPPKIKNIRDHRREWCMSLIKNEIKSNSREILFNTHFDFLPQQEIKPFFDELQLIPRLQEKIDNFSDRFFKNKKVIGMHVRYYDKSLPVSNHTPYWLEPEKSFERIESEIQEIISSLKGQDYVVYLATDSEIVYDFAKNKIPNLVTYKNVFKMLLLHLTSTIKLRKRLMKMI